MSPFLKQLGKPQLTAVLAIMWTLAAIGLYFGIGNPSDQTLEKVQGISMMIVSYLFGKTNNRNNENAV